jgi:hypothetical protein
MLLLIIINLLPETKSGSLSSNLSFPRFDIALKRPHLRRWRCQCGCWFTLAAKFYKEKSGTISWWAFLKMWDQMKNYPFSKSKLASSVQIGNVLWSPQKTRGVAYCGLGIYLWSKVVCLFCFVCTDEIHWTGMLQIAFLVSLQSSRGEGCLSLVSWCLDLQCRSSWILNDFFTEN